MNLEKQIQEAKEILQSEFGFAPRQSRLVYHDSDSWIKLTKRKSNIKGLYQPRSLTTNIKSASSQILLPVVIHEYLAHGSYCEHARNGRKIVRFEQELSKLEEELSEQKLPKNSVIQIASGETCSLEKSQDSNYDYILHAKSGNPVLKKYLTKQREYNKFFRANFLTYEGFAIWLEEWLLKQLGQEDIWKARQSQLKSPYLDFYEEFKRFEAENGSLSLIYRVGFPKQFDNKSITRVAGEHLDLSKLRFLIVYGSKRDYGDIDLLAVHKADSNIKNICITQDLDIIQVKEDEFNERIKLLDIELTEPLLTGNLVLGDSSDFARLQAQLRTQKVSAKSFQHLHRRSLQALNYAIYFYNQGVYEATQGLLSNGRTNRAVERAMKGEVELVSPYFLPSLHSISYAISYALSNRAYITSNKVMTLAELTKIDKTKQLSSLLDYIKRIKRGLALPKRSKTKEFLDRAVTYVHQ